MRDMNLWIKNASFRVSFLKQHVCCDLKRSKVENQSSAVAVSILLIPCFQELDLY